MFLWMLSGCKEKNSAFSSSMHNCTTWKGVCVYSLWLWFSLVSPSLCPTNPRQRHWSKTGAKSHLATLPPLKQIRPQRLIKKKREKEVCVQSLLPQTGGWRVGYQKGSHSELQDLKLLFTANKKCQSPSSPNPLFHCCSNALMLYCSLPSFH